MVGAGPMLSVCSGAFVLGAAGLLDGRRCTTHWRYVDELAQLYPGTDLGIESVATRSGFGTAALLRHHFRRVVGVAPQDYRRTFSSTSRMSSSLG